MKKNIKKSIYLIITLQKLLIKKNLVNSQQKILLGFSGGQDSICLVIFFILFKDQWDLQINILWFNHFWQKESMNLFYHISKLCFYLKIKMFTSLPIFIPNTELKGRNWRSKKSLRLLEFFNFTSLLTGHTASDQIETLLFNLFRGSGSQGLSALKWKKIIENKKQINFLFTIYDLNNLNKKRKTFKKYKLQKNLNFKKIKKNTLFYKNFLVKKKLIKNNKEKIFIFLFFRNLKKNFIESQNKKKLSYFFFKKKFIKKNKKKFFVIRPLLKLTRFDLKKICHFLSLPIYPDQSNEKNEYSRNCIRKKFLPPLRLFFNPQIDFILMRYTEIIVDEKIFFYFLKKNIYLYIDNNNKKIFSINISFIASLPLYIQRKFYKNFIENNLKTNIDFSTIDIFLKIFKKKQDNSVKKKYKWFFFPKIGFFFKHSNVLSFIKTS